MTHDPVREFYDRFSKRLLMDMLVPNRRVLKQFAFVRDATPAAARRVLVVGVGTGELAHFIATGVAREAEVVGVDISGENLRLAERLFHHPRVRFERHDIVASGPDGPFDVVVFPDSYEHLPAASRARVHGYLATTLASRARVLLACPTVMKQAALRVTGGLQVVDEDVTLRDVERLAEDVGGVVTHFSMVQVWATYDYFYAVVERGVDELAPVRQSGPLPIHRGESPLRTVASMAAGYGGLTQSSRRVARVLSAMMRRRRNDV